MDKLKKFLFVSLLLPILAEAKPIALSWEELPSLPPSPDQKHQPGVASPFVGVHHGALIVAGGANFPGAPPWLGGKKTWWDTIFVFEGGVWRSGGTLPRPLAYGQSYSLPEGVLCVGGMDAFSTRSEVFLLRLNRGEIECIDFPPLPEPIAFSAGGEMDGKIFLAGGQTDAASPASIKRAYMLDVRKKPLTWQRLPDLPGAPRSLSIGFAVERGNRPGFYLFGGRDQRPREIPEIFADGFRYDPVSGQWQALKPMRKPLMAGTAVPYGKGQAIVLGGDDGKIFLVKEKLNADIRLAEAKSSPDVPALKASEKKLLESHPGFSRQCHLYDAGTDTWTRAGTLPAWPPVTTTAVWWNQQIVLPSGEIRPATRSPIIWAGRIRE